MASNGGGIEQRAGVKQRHRRASRSRCEGQKALVLAAHYDSVAEGPGAGDDASGVAAILEALRAVKAGPPLDRDVIALFTDGEEGYGTPFRGSRTFIDDPEWRNRAGLILNFESRGDAGASFLFETSEQNGRLIREFSRGAEYPLGTSLAYDVYKLMPNDTDLFEVQRSRPARAEFRVRGTSRPLPHVARYAAKPRSRKPSASGLVRGFAGPPTSARWTFRMFPKSPTPSTFPFFGPHLIVYPGSYVLPLMGLAVIAWNFVLGIGLRRQKLSIMGLMLGVLLAFGSLIVTFTAGWFGMAAYRLIPGTRNGPMLAAMLAVLAFVVAMILYLPAWKRAKSAEIAMGGLFWWLVLTILSAIALPGGSYLFLWPLMGAILGLGIAMFSGRFSTAANYLGAIPMLILLPPTIAALWRRLGPESSVHFGSANNADGHRLGADVGDDFSGGSARSVAVCMKLRVAFEQIFAMLFHHGEELGILDIPQRSVGLILDKKSKIRKQLSESNVGRKLAEIGQFSDQFVLYRGNHGKKSSIFGSPVRPRCIPQSNGRNHGVSYAFCSATISSFFIVIMAATARFDAAGSD